MTIAQYRLTERVIIEKFKERSKDDDGNLIDIFEEYYSCWANFRPLSGKKFAEQQATQYKRVDSFIIRYCKKADDMQFEDLEKFKLTHRERIYSIKYIYDIKNEHNFIDLECEINE